MSLLVAVLTVTCLGQPWIEPAPEPEPAVELSAVADVTVWDALAECESHGEWDYDPATATWGNRLFHGGLQFHPDTWTGFAPDGYPAYAHQASRAAQIAVAERVLAVQGWGAWPACTKKLGLR